MLEDVQERLVYRASVYVRTDILSYQPAPGDLAYPEKLEMMKVFHLLVTCEHLIKVFIFFIFYFLLLSS